MTTQVCNKKLVIIKIKSYFKAPVSPENSSVEALFLQDPLHRSQAVFDPGTHIDEKCDFNNWIGLHLLVERLIIPVIKIKNKLS